MTALSPRLSFLYVGSKSLILFVLFSVMNLQFCSNVFDPCYPLTTRFEIECNMRNTVSLFIRLVAFL
jgi:hypothetical protein